MQKRIAEEATLLVHSKEDLENAKRASQILFGKSTSEDLMQLDEATFLDVFEGVYHKPNFSKNRFSKKDWIIIAALAGEGSFRKIQLVKREEP